MKHNRIILILCVIIASSMQTFAERTVVVSQLSAGDLQSEKFSPAWKLVFTNDAFSIVSSTGDIIGEVDLADGMAITFASGNYDGERPVITPAGEEISIVQKDDKIFIENVIGDGDVAIYSVAGHCLLRQYIHAGEVNVLDVSAFSSGIYLLSVNKKVFKLIIK